MKLVKPTWMRCLIYIGVPVFSCLTLYSVVLILMHREEIDFVGFASIAFFVAGLGWLSVRGLQLLKYAAAEVEYSETGFEVSLRGECFGYAWSDIGEVTNYSGASLLRLKDRDGKTVYVVDHATPGYAEFFATVERNVPRPQA